MKSILILTTSCMLLALSACGGKLTDAQKVQLKGLNQSVGQSVEVGKKVGQKNTGLVNNGLSILDKSPKNTGDENLAKIVGRISDESKTGACEIQSFEPQAKPTNGKLVDLSFGIKGDRCPVVSAYSMAMTDSGAMDFSFSYKVNDEELAKYSDVTEANMKMNMTLTIAQSQKSGSFDLKGDGNIVSATYGNVKMKYSGSIAMSQGSASGTIKAEVAFSDFTGELGITLNGQKVSYSINGESVTAEQFAEYGQTLQGGMGSSLGGGQMTDSPDLSTSPNTPNMEEPSIPTEPFSAVFKFLL